MPKQAVSKRKMKKTPPNKWKQVGNTGLTAGLWLWDFLWSMIELMPDPAEGRREYIRRLDGCPKEVSSRRVNEEIKRMQKRGWVLIAEKRGKKFIKLTEKGRLALLYKKLQSIVSAPKQKWDSTWWMAIYDIPEKGKSERQMICRTLCAAGFRYLQKSVYIYPFELPEELIIYLRDKKLLPFIRFVHVDKIDGVRELEKHFNLSRSQNVPLKSK